MSDNAPPGMFRQVAGVLGDVSGMVAIVVAYVLAVTGRSPGPIPQTTSIITVLLTTAVLWLWRANRITRREAHSTPVEISEAQATSAPVTGAQPQTPRPVLRPNRLLDPFRNTGNPPYEMSLARRRIELMGLAALTVVVAGWSAGRVTAAVPELTGLRAGPIPPVTCYPSLNASGPRVVIADFEDAAPQYASLIENRLFDSLTDDTGGGRTVCRLRQVVGTREDAQAVGRQTQAVIVIWGRSDAIFDVHIELADNRSDTWIIPGRTLPPLPAEELADFHFAEREPLRLSFLSDLVLSQALYLDNRPSAAREILGRALERAEAQDLARDNAADLGEAYFLLGYMHDPYVNRSQEDPQPALAAYTRSLELNPTLDAARLNRGMVYVSAGQNDLATADFDSLIDGRGKLAADAAVNRAFLQADRTAAERDFAMAIPLNPVMGHWQRGIARLDLWNDLTGALDDFEKVVQLDPANNEYLQGLGEAQLLAGQAGPARDTYRRLAPRLDDAARLDVIDHLQALAVEKPELASVVDVIVADLRGEPLP